MENIDIVSRGLFESFGPFLAPTIRASELGDDRFEGQIGASGE